MTIGLIDVDGKDRMMAEERSIFIDFMTSHDCYNPYESYGMCCVGCGCCSDNPLEQAKARLALHERLLEDDLSFDGWFDDPEIRALQEENVKKNIAWNKERITTYKEIINALEKSYKEIADAEEASR